MRIRKYLKSALSRLFLIGDRVNVHILPKHYYTSIPDHRWLESNKKLWTSPTEMNGIDWDFDAQLRWLGDICLPYRHEVAGLKLYDEISAKGVGPGFGPIESQVLHCFIRAVAPPRVVEIGSGVSTACMQYASDRNRQQGKAPCQITCIEPFPRKRFQNVRGISHIRQTCQAVSLTVFEELQAGDLLFVDSTHAVKCGSDVLRIWLDIVPKLRPGVYVHAHDIHFPYLYDRDILSSYLDWQETSLLLALLINNHQFTVLASLSGLHYEKPNAVTRILPDYRPQANIEGLRDPNKPDGHYPSSAWMITKN